MAKTIVAWHQLPPEILMFHILPRFPVKSLFRFMCVSKQWHLFLKTRIFSDIHLHHVTNDNNDHHKLLFSIRGGYFWTIDCEAPQDDLTACHPLPFKAYRLRYLHKSYIIIASCNGLICLGILKSMNDVEYIDLIIWNPLTAEYKTLSKANSHKECYKKDGSAFGMYYTSFDDDYRLLRVTHDHEFDIYSLKNDSWRRVTINSTNDFLSNPLCCWRPPYSWKPMSTYLNDNLYFLKQTMRGSYNLRAYSVIRFNTKIEKFTELTTPSFGDQTSTCLSFTTQRGRIHLCVMLNVGEEDATKWCIELWSMDGDGDWMKLITYSWIPCLETGAKFNSLYNLEPLYIMRNGSLLYYIFGERSQNLYKVDPENHTNNKLSSRTFKKMLLPQRKGTYIETFVSPNQYMK